MLITKEKNMTAIELFNEKGYTFEDKTNYIEYRNVASFVRFSKTDKAYWTNLTDISDLKTAIYTQMQELGWV